jgi:phosphoribosylformimino-5-aminoimidazole carboxamide ribonucleotide (ProFAR) isomerase
VIVGSALFTHDGIDLAFAERLASRVARDRLVAAVDSRGGRVVIHGWRTELALGPADAVKRLEPYVGGFLYTHVDREGLMQGTDLAAIEAVAAATTRRVTAAGGITTREEIDYLDARGIDAVVGMALYTGRLAIGDAGT